MQPITDKRGRVLHRAADDITLKPLCRPHTRVTFRPTLWHADMQVCETCDDRDLRARYAKGER